MEEAVERLTVRLRASIGVIDPRGSRTPIYNNPEGPEAADLIEQMAATLEAMASALERIEACSFVDSEEETIARTTLTQYRQGDL